jgi:choline dehydrogenase-like flavoprotein
MRLRQREKRGMTLMEKTVSALAYSLRAALTSDPDRVPPRPNVPARFILGQISRMPDYLRWPMRIMTCVFGLTGFAFGGASFHRLNPTQRARQIRWWSTAPLGPCRDFIKFHQSLTVLAANDVDDAAAALGSREPPLFSVTVRRPGRCEIAVIGSGPGGAITACLAAEAGRQVTLFEEGGSWAPGSVPPFSLEEMVQKYRNGGINVAMGGTKIAYVEGRCVGGGSEINSGLYHRTPPEILEEWRKRHQVEGLTDGEMAEHFAACEGDLSVGLLRGEAPAASLRLQQGAQRLGWKSMEVPRWFRYDETGGTRQSMSRTYIPRAVAAQCDLQVQTRITRLRREGSGWRLEGQRADGEPLICRADTVFVAAGAVQTPALLLRSGIGGNVGRSLRLHPTVKVIAAFREAVNAAGMGVPVHQVKEFSPAISFGCSISSRPFLAVGMLDHPDDFAEVLRRWEQAAVYYAMISPRGTGMVRSLPGFRDPLVRYRLEKEDRRALADGLRNLCRLLLEAGAERLYGSIRGSASIKGSADLDGLPAEVPAGDTGLMTIHLFSSVPMGENRSQCGADSFGRMFDLPNLHVNDASLLCGAPGVNPQGTIMAIARRNTLKFLGKLN